MGFSISWVAVRGRTKSAVLSHLLLVDTGVVDEVNESPISGSELPGGWYLVFLNDVSHLFADSASAELLSVGGEVLTCHVEEHVMASAASSYADGKFMWEILHESDLGIYHLDSRGELPAIYASVRDRLAAQQAEADAASAGVDYMFDIPIVTVYELCGYRYDNAYLKSGGSATFTQLVGADA